MNSRERRHARRGAAQSSSSDAPDFGVETEDGGHWTPDGRYFVWNWKPQSMTKELSAADMNRMLVRRPTPRAEGQQR